MKIYAPKAVASVIFTCAALFLGGCSKNSVNMYSGDHPENDPTNSGNGSNSQTTLVTFHASVESRNMTRSLTPMRKGVVSQLYAYKAPATSLEEATAEGLYYTSTTGILSGVKDYKMYLPNGIYYFYAVSENVSALPPLFIDNESLPLENGVDYLWGSNKLQDVSSSQVSIPLFFTHMATQVVINIAAGEGLDLDKVVSATLTPSLSGSKMNLLNGKIIPATEYDLPTRMGINQFTMQLIMLPLETTKPMSLVLKVLADGETTPRTYTASIPVPNGQLVGGNSYLFSALINGNTVSFSDADVIGWTDVDETGNPLYPIQK